MPLLCEQFVFSTKSQLYEHKIATLYVCTFWSTRLKLKEVDIKKQAQRRIRIVHGSSTIEATYLVRWSVSIQNYGETTV